MRRSEHVQQLRTQASNVLMGHVKQLIEEIGTAEFKPEVPIGTREGMITDIIIKGKDTSVGIISEDTTVAYTVYIFALREFALLQVLKEMEKWMEANPK